MKSLSIGDRVITSDRRIGTITEFLKLYGKPCVGIKEDNTATPILRLFHEVKKLEEEDRKY